MTNLIKLFIAVTILLISGTVAAERMVLVYQAKVTSDMDTFLTVIKKANALDERLNPNDYPNMRVVQHTLSGATTTATTIHAGNKEWAASQKRMNEKYPVIWAATATQLLFRQGK